MLLLLLGLVLAVGAAPRPALASPAAPAPPPLAPPPAPGPPPLASATPQEPPREPLLQGVLRLGGEPADSGTIVLHHVTPAEAGPLDSVRVAGDGTFSFLLPELPRSGSEQVYFASTRREGVLYFGMPVTEPGQLDSVYVIDAYATRPAPEGGLPFTVSARTLFVDEGPMGWRVTDLVEIRNDSSVTWLPGNDGRAVWRYPLPETLRSPRVVQQTETERAIRFDGAALEVHAPVPPGERLYAVQYEVESVEFALPLPGATDVVEILVAEPAPALVMEGLRPAQPVELEADRTYLRWVGADFVDDAVQIRRGSETPVDLRPWVGVALAVLLLVATVWMVRRPGAAVVGAASGANGSTSSAPASRREILLAVARLDEEFEERGRPGGEEAERYRERRRALLRRLDEGPGEAASGRRREGPESGGSAR